MKHSPVGPSRLERVRICPGSVKLCAALPEPLTPVQDSPEASEGKMKHALYTEIVLKRMKKCEYDDVMWCVDQTEEIIDLLGGRKHVLLVAEKYMPLHSIGIEGGTPDLLIVVPGEIIAVVDEKYGFRYVAHPKKNLQFKAYGYGAWDLYGADTIVPVKLQPNTPFEDTRKQLCNWHDDDMEEIGEEIREVIKAAQEIGAPLVRSDYCVWCPAKRSCPQWAETALMVPRNTDVLTYLRRLDPVQRTSLLAQMQTLSKWVEMSLKDMIEAGVTDNEELRIEYDGLEPKPTKMFKGWSDPKKAEQAMRELAKTHKKVKVKDIVKVQRSIASPADAFKMFGRSQSIQEKLNHLITETPAKNKTLKPIKKQ